MSPRSETIFACTHCACTTGTAASRPATAASEPARCLDRLLVCNKADNSLSIFDPSTRHEVAVVPTGIGPHEVPVSPDGRLAVVSDYGAQKPGHTLTVVDIVTATVRTTIELTHDVKGDRRHHATEDLSAPARHPVRRSGPLDLHE